VRERHTETERQTVSDKVTKKPVEKWIRFARG